MSKTLSYINTTRKKEYVPGSVPSSRPGVSSPGYSPGITVTEAVNRIMPLIAGLNAYMVSLLVRDSYLYNPGFADGAKGWAAGNPEEVSITESNGNMVVRLTGSGVISQANERIRKPSKHKEYMYSQEEDVGRVAYSPGPLKDTLQTEAVEWEPLEYPERKEGSEEKDDVLYLSIGYVCKEAGMLHAGFVGSDESAEGALKLQSVQTDVSEDVQYIITQGTWDGKGDFHIYLNGGQVEIRSVFLLDNPLDEYRKQTDSHIAQIEENIGIMLDSIKADIDRIKLVQDYINQLFNNDAIIDGFIYDIETSIEEINKTLASHSEGISSAQSTASSAYSIASYNSWDISSLYSSVSSLSSSIDSLGSSISSLEGRVSALESSSSGPGEET